MKQYAFRAMHNNNLHPTYKNLSMYSSKLLKILPIKRSIKNNLQDKNKCKKN